MRPGQASRPFFQCHQAAFAAHVEVVEKAVAQQHEGHGNGGDNGFHVMHGDIAYAHFVHVDLPAAHNAIGRAQTHSPAVPVVQPEAIDFGIPDGKRRGA